MGMGIIHKSEVRRGYDKINWVWLTDCPSEDIDEGGGRRSGDALG